MAKKGPKRGLSLKNESALGDLKFINKIGNPFFFTFSNAYRKAPFVFFRPLSFCPFVRLFFCLKLSTHSLSFVLLTFCPLVILPFCPLPPLFYFPFVLFPLWYLSFLPSVIFPFLSFFPFVFFFLFVVFLLCPFSRLSICLFLSPLSSCPVVLNKLLILCHLSF